MIEQSVSETKKQKRVRVVDVPSTTTPETAEELLNEVCEQGYYVLTIVPGDLGVTRAFFGKRRVLQYVENSDGRQDEALAIINAHPRESLRVLVERLRRAGIKRGKTWVSEKRLNTGQARLPE